MDYEDSLIVKTAWYYYIENMTQQKISEKLGYPHESHQTVGKGQTDRGDPV